MLTRGLSLALTLMALEAHSFEPGTYFSSPTVTEAKLSYDHVVELVHEGKPTLEKARNAALLQARFLSGALAAREQGSPKREGQVSRLAISLKPGMRKTWLVSYHYADTVMLNKNGLIENEATVPLPRDPSKVYKAGLVTVGEQTFAPCTDFDHQSESSLWYFWSPDRPGCPLIEGQDYDRVPVRFERLANVELSMPEYDRLPDSRKRITAYAFFGMNVNDGPWDPRESQDIAAVEYLDFRGTMERAGYTVRTLDSSEIGQLTGGRGVAAGRRIPAVEEFTRVFGTTPFTVTAMFGPTSADAEGKVFHWLYKRALESASVVMYSGHSGLGARLNPATLEELEGYKLNIPATRYQILLLNGCSSYTHYNRKYFNRKATAADRRGTRNLDILSTGLPSSFLVGARMQGRLLRAIEDWAAGWTAPSYQEIIADLGQDYLYSVDGDQDNPTVAKQPPGTN